MLIFEQIAEAAAKTSPSKRVIKKIEIGQSIRQGDIYLTRIDSVPNGLTKTANTQLAVGKTQGSRHVVVGVKTIYAGTGVLIGPVLVAEKRFTLTHPEHGHFSMPAGTYQTTYQRDYAKERADEIRRVND